MAVCCCRPLWMCCCVALYTSSLVTSFMRSSWSSPCSFPTFNWNAVGCAALSSMVHEMHHLLIHKNGNCWFYHVCLCLLAKYPVSSNLFYITADLILFCLIFLQCMKTSKRIKKKLSNVDNPWITALWESQHANWFVTQCNCRKPFFFKCGYIPCFHWIQTVLPNPCVGKMWLKHYTSAK